MFTEWHTVTKTIFGGYGVRTLQIYGEKHLKIKISKLHIIFPNSDYVSKNMPFWFIVHHVENQEFSWYELFIIGGARGVYHCIASNPAWTSKNLFVSGKHLDMTDELTIIFKNPTNILI